MFKALLHDIGIFQQLSGLKKTTFGIRLSLENFSAFYRIHVVPLYAISNLFHF